MNGTPLTIAIGLLLSAGIHADTLVLKNGQTVAAQSFLRQGDSLVVAAGPGGGPATSTPLKEIEKVELTPSPLLGSAPALLATGKAAEVLTDSKEAVKLAEVFGDLPGSHWPDLMVLQAHVLLATGGHDEAEKLAAVLEKTKKTDLVSDARAIRLLIAARKGDCQPAASLAEPLMEGATRPSTLAAASVALGLACLEGKQFENALKAFLELPVFLPEQTALDGIAQLGAAHAYYGMEDYERAIAALESLIKSRPGTPEISTAQTLLPEWKRRQSVLLEAKES